MAACTLVGVGASAHQAWSANISTTVSDMFPRRVAGSVTGIDGMAGGLGGVIISWFSGHIFDYFESQSSIEIGYALLFGFCGIAYLLAWIIMKALVPKYKLITDL